MFKIPKKVDSGILYVLEIQLEEKALVKIGVTQREKVEDRVCEILTSIWKRYRIYPQCYIKRYRTVSNVYQKEKEMHERFDEYRYGTEHKFSGCTEMFDVELEKVVEVYDDLYNSK